MIEMQVHAVTPVVVYLLGLLIALLLGSPRNKALDSAWAGMGNFFIVLWVMYVVIDIAKWASR